MDQVVKMVRKFVCHITNHLCVEALRKGTKKFSRMVNILSENWNLDLQTVKNAL